MYSRKKKKGGKKDLCELNTSRAIWLAVLRDLQQVRLIAAAVATLISAGEKKPHLVAAEPRRPCLPPQPV